MSFSRFSLLYKVIPDFPSNRASGQALLPGRSPLSSVVFSVSRGLSRGLLNSRRRGPDVQFWTNYVAACPTSLNIRSHTFLGTTSTPFQITARHRGMGSGQGFAGLPPRPRCSAWRLCLSGKPSRHLRRSFSEHLSGLKPPGDAGSSTGGLDPRIPSLLLGTGV